MEFAYSFAKPRAIPKAVFRKIATDVRIVLGALEAAGIPLAGWDAVGRPEITSEVIRFNGSATCGHPVGTAIVLEWEPDPNCRRSPHFRQTTRTDAATVMRSVRWCDGDCSGEPFSFVRVEAVGEPPTEALRDGQPNTKTVVKTGDKPYDWAVTCSLVIADYHLRGACNLHSDGGSRAWLDAYSLCYELLVKAKELPARNDPQSPLGTIPRQT